jgi:hypothetical protein
MRIALAASIALTLALAALASPGIFIGELIPPPHPAADGSWLYVKGRNSMVRRVDIAGARVFYGESVADRDRRRNASESLIPGAEVRVTADQNSSGEWRAEQVEITRIAQQHSPLR